MRVPKCFSKLKQQNHNQLHPVPSRLEVQTIVQFSSPQIAAAIELTCDLALRANELLDLRWGDVDLERRMIRVANNKHGDRHRLVHLTLHALGLLSGWRSRNKFNSAEHFIFARKGGERLSEELLRAGLKIAVDHANESLAARGDRPVQPRWHDFRRYAVSERIKSGTPPTEVTRPAT